jgi:PAT family beta-lactamase induction signal transducer AmpG
MGSTNATFGLFAGFAVVTLPEMLAAQGVAGGRIAAIVALVLSPAFWSFLLSPILDVRFSRRTYALAFSMVAAVSIALAVTFRTHIAAVEAIVIVGFTAASLVQGAVGGWMGSLMMLAAGEIVTHLPPPLAGTLIGSLLLLPSLLYIAIPAPPPDGRLAAESFRQFFRSILTLVQRREVLVALMLFLLPASSFALTNVLGGIGKDFSATERMVSLFAGVGSAVAGVVASLLLPPLARRLPLRPLYLAIGIAGALFTLSLLLLPQTPATFAIAITGQNGFQALSIAAASAIAFETLGPANPLAATQFSVLLAAINLPITLMGVIDGRAYTWRGVPAAFFVDASISLVVCTLLLLALHLLHRRARTAKHRVSAAIG